jgi:hypothetical protein
LSQLRSSQAGSRRVAIAKPKNDIFVVLLSIAVGAVVIACILLALEMNNYQWSVNPKVSQRVLPTVAQPHDLRMPTV